MSNFPYFQDYVPYFQVEISIFPGVFHMETSIFPGVFSIFPGIFPRGNLLISKNISHIWKSPYFQQFFHLFPTPGLYFYNPTPLPCRKREKGKFHPRTSEHPLFPQEFWGKNLEKSQSQLGRLQVRKSLNFWDHPRTAGV